MELCVGNTKENKRHSLATIRLSKQINGNEKANDSRTSNEYEGSEMHNLRGVQRKQTWPRI
jgi:hypothetical protein